MVFICQATRCHVQDDHNLISKGRWHGLWARESKWLMHFCVWRVSDLTVLHGQQCAIDFVRQVLQNDSYWDFGVTAGDQNSGLKTQTSTGEN